MKIYWHKGSKNIIGPRVKEIRHMSKPIITQENLSAKLELMGISLDRLSISRIESGNRFVTDYEVVALSKALNVSIYWLLLGE